LNKEQAFYYLSLYQYAINRQQLQKAYSDVMTEKHPDVGRLRSIKSIKDNFSYVTCPAMPPVYKKISTDLDNNSKPYQILKDISSLEQMKENLPGQSGYLIMQMSDDKQFMYIAYCQINKERKFKYYNSKIRINNERRAHLNTMVENLASLKTEMQKTPITIEEDLQALEMKSELAINKLVQDLEEFLQPVTTVLHELIHPEIKEEEKDGDAAADPKASKKEKKDDGKKAAKPAGKPGKGAASTEVAAYESPLPLTTGGIESMVIMVDQMLETLPIESLQVFKNIAVVSRDFNLHLHLNRLKNVGHKAEMHNNLGIAKEDLSYIVEIPDKEVLKNVGGHFVQDEMPKLAPGSKWEGILTHTDHIPSEGEWQQRIANSSFFAYFSMTCLLHKFPSHLISDLSIFNKCKAMAIFDRMNTYKTLVDRNVMTSKHFSPDEQPMQQAALFSLCGISSIVINHWSTKPEDNFEQFTNLMRGTLGEGVYLGSAAFKKGAKASARP